MKVQAVTKYVYKGVEYNSLEAIKEKLHDIIGTEVLDRINKECPPQRHRDFIKMLDILCDPDIRNVLMECYTVTFEEENELEEFGQDNSRTINVLDV